MSLPTALRGVYHTALRLSFNYSKAASDVGYDWDSIEGVQDKLIEELHELLNETDPNRIAEEIGDLMFVLVNYYRWIGGNDPEDLLNNTCAKFYNRFGAMEKYAGLDGKKIDECTMGDFGRYWQMAKKLEE